MLKTSFLPNKCYPCLSDLLISFYKTLLLGVELPVVLCRLTKEKQWEDY